MSRDDGLVAAPGRLHAQVPLTRETLGRGPVGHDLRSADARWRGRGGLEAPIPASRERAHLAGARVAFVLAVALVGCQEERQPPERRRLITDWFEVDSIAPILSIPHVLRLGPVERAFVLRAGTWREVYEGKESGATVLEDGAAVLIRSTGEIQRPDPGRVARLPRSDCPERWFEHILVVDQLKRIVCVQASSSRGEGRIRITQFDGGGRFVRTDELGAPEHPIRVKGNADYNSHLVSGLTPEGAPVVVAQVGVEARGFPVYAVFVLNPSGPREVGRFSAWYPNYRLDARDVEKVAGSLEAFPAR